MIFFGQATICVSYRKTAQIKKYEEANNFIVCLKNLRKLIRTTQVLYGWVGLLLVTVFLPCFPALPKRLVPFLSATKYCESEIAQLSKF